MEKQKVYCMNCEKAIELSNLNSFMNNIAKEPQPEEYKNGWYCGSCNKLKQEQARKNLGGR